MLKKRILTLCLALLLLVPLLAACKQNSVVATDETTENGTNATTNTEQTAQRVSTVTYPGKVYGNLPAAKSVDQTARYAPFWLPEIPQENKQFTYVFTSNLPPPPAERTLTVGDMTFRLYYQRTERGEDLYAIRRADLPEEVLAQCSEEELKMAEGLISSSVVAYKEGRDTLKYFHNLPGTWETLPEDITDEELRERALAILTPHTKLPLETYTCTITEEPFGIRSYHGSYERPKNAKQRVVDFTIQYGEGKKVAIQGGNVRFGPNGEVYAALITPNFKETTLKRFEELDSDYILSQVRAYATDHLMDGWTLTTCDLTRIVLRLSSSLEYRAVVEIAACKQEEGAVPTEPYSLLVTFEVVDIPATATE